MIKYKSFLPITERTPIISLGEGDTPFIKLQKILPTFNNIFVKCEGSNPTGSFKDRGMALAVSKALEKGVKTIICASTGNTSASAAAHAARAGIDCIVMIPKGKVARGKNGTSRYTWCQYY